MNKRGFLLAEETIKMIIALIALTFLTYFLVSLYITNTQNKKIVLAEESLDFILQEISLNKENIEIYNPEDWEIISWNNEGIMPKACSNFGWNNCLCICSPLGFIGTGLSYLPFVEDKTERQARYCDELGACQELKKQVTPEKFSISDPPLFLNIEQSEERISLTKK